jgi:hypothetical protein
VHPFAADAAAQAARADSVSPAGADAMNSVPIAPRAQGALFGLNKGGNKNGAGRGTGNVLGPTPNLTGFAQVVGLALGSPEFQRR